MTTVKARDLSHEEWTALFEPYGWAEITTRSPRMPLGGKPPFVLYEFRVMLKGSPDRELGEWAHRAYLLDQARQAVETVQAKGYVLPDAPRIEFGGQYRYYLTAERGAAWWWLAQAELSFSVNSR